MPCNSNSSRHIVSNTHFLNTTRPVSSNLAEVSLVCERSFILLPHTLQGGTFSTGSVPVFAVSPHKAPGTPQKLACRSYYLLLQPPTPLPRPPSICLFQCSTSCPTSGIRFCGGGPCVGEVSRPLCFQKSQNNSVI